MREKGISTVIAAILLLMIVITLAGTAYMFTSGFLTSKISTSFSIIGSADDVIVVRNDGSEPITSFKHVAVDGNPIELGFELQKVLLGSSYNAAQAEGYCKTNFGSEWQLFVPTSSEDLVYAWELAHSGDDQSNNYLYILGIYPKIQGSASTCVRTAMTSEDCTTWRATDDGTFWIGTKTTITEPNGDNCEDGSMYYSWNGDGSINWYNDINCPGYTSTRFMCEKGQIEPQDSATLRILSQLTEGTHKLRLCTPSMCTEADITIT